jgi:hypothetical protein
MSYPSWSLVEGIDIKGIVSWTGKHRCAIFISNCFIGMMST